MPATTPPASATGTAATATAVPAAGRASAVLAWCVAAAHPFALFAGVQAGPYRSTELRLFLTAVGVGLLLPLARRRPEAALGLLLVGLFAAATTWPSPSCSTFRSSPPTSASGGWRPGVRCGSRCPPPC